ncbi:hypothetical protein QMM92_18690, partial [Leptospira santarosai]|nr:hypothetical protein [Leptospira santarosai]
RENRKIIWLLFTSRALLLFSISLIDSFETRSKSKLTFNTSDRLTEDHGNFNAFLRNITEDVKLGKVKSEYNKREQGPDPGSSKIPLALSCNFPSSTDMQFL